MGNRASTQPPALLAPYDLDECKKLLARAGATENGLRIDLAANTDNSSREHQPLKVTYHNQTDSDLCLTFWWRTRLIIQQRLSDGTYVTLTPAEGPKVGRRIATVSQCHDVFSRVPYC